VFPNKVNNRWPAIIFADNRIARVPGRITFLIVSMHTIKGIKIGGVPWGTKWANICCVLFNHPYIIKDSHKGKDNIIVKTIWLVLVKIYGNNPKKLLNKIKVNKEIKIIEFPFLCGFIKILNSKWRLFKILFHKKKNREGRSQNLRGINKRPKKVLNQFKGIHRVVIGSKTENRFVIIFNLKNVIYLF
jgi:hypothetical protein